MPLKLILFDLDGTLVDSSVDITNALNYALGPYKFAPLTKNEVIKLVGEGVTRLIEKLVGNMDISAIDDVKGRFLEHYSRHIVDHTREYPGVRETLEALSGYKKAIISNKREALSRKTLEGLGLAGYFELVIGSDTTPEKKPSPAPIFRALSGLETSPAEAVMVGDSNFDVDAGKAAGITTIAVTYGYRPLEAIRHADYLIDRMEDLLPLLDKLASVR